MTYNTTRRRRFSKKQRAAFLERHGATCYWCRQPILPGQPWAIEHMVARELLPDATADDDSNLAPIHAHPATCHKIKTRMDIKAIRKSDRVRRALGPVELRKKKTPIRSRPFSKGKSRPIPSRPFPKRGD